MTRRREGVCKEVPEIWHSPRVVGSRIKDAF